MTSNFYDFLNRPVYILQHKQGSNSTDNMHKRFMLSVDYLDGESLTRFGTLNQKIDVC